MFDYNPELWKISRSTKIRHLTRYYSMRDWDPEFESMDPGDQIEFETELKTRHGLPQNTEIRSYSDFETALEKRYSGLSPGALNFIYKTTRKNRLIERSRATWKDLKQ